MRVLSLFAGIGGFDLGLERTGGFKTVAFCEIDKKAQAVLRKHWPEVPVYGDVRELTASRLRADGIVPNVICGGFPCQDISTAGTGVGIEGARSGLWSEIARLTGELRPSYVIVENVSALLSRGLDRVLGDLAALGYDAEWHCIPAFAVGAHHRRDRIWIVGYPGSAAGERNAGAISGAEARERGAREQDGHSPVRPEHAGAGGGAGHDPDANVTRLEGRHSGRLQERPGERTAGPLGASVANAECERLAGRAWGGMSRTRGTPIFAPCLAEGLGGQWDAEPDVGRVANGIPKRVDRLKQLGNAVVPQVVELIGRAILAAQKEAA